MRRPVNHVTRAMQANVVASSGGWPDLDPQLIAYLEATYPPRCKRPGESLEEHMLYAGKVELVATLRDRLSQTADFEGREEDDLDVFHEEP